MTERTFTEKQVLAMMRMASERAALHDALAAWRDVLWKRLLVERKCDVRWSGVLHRHLVATRSVMTDDEIRKMCDDDVCIETIANKFWGRLSVIGYSL